MRGSDSLPAGSAFTRTILIMNKLALLATGLVSVGVFGFETLRTGEIAPIEVLMLVAGAIALIYGTRTFKRSVLEYSLGLFANVVFVMFFFGVAIDAARDGQTVGALLLTAATTGMFVVPAICMTRACIDV